MVNIALGLSVSRACHVIQESFMPSHGQSKKEHCGAGNTRSFTSLKCMVILNKKRKVKFTVNCEHANCH